MPRKRTKKEALERLSTVDLIPDVDVNASPRLRAVHEQLSLIQGAAKFGAAGLIMLDPLNRLADERIVLPLDMVAIPAYQAFMIQGSPSMQIYIRAGETIIPTGGNVKDVQEALDEVTTPSSPPPSRRRKPTAYSKAYSRAFKALRPKYTLKNGKWAKNGFKRCVKAAHAQVKTTERLMRGMK